MATLNFQRHVLALSILGLSIHRLLAKGGIESFRRAVSDASVDEVSFKEEVQTAATEVLGCGGPVGTEWLMATRSRLLPMWEALPKNGNGRVERRALRYLGHRYFIRHFGISLRGFEPAPAANISNASMVDILSQRVPGYLETLLGNSTALGFSLAEAVYMINMLEHLISDEQIMLLEHVYDELNFSTKQALQHKEARQVLESFIAHWIIGEEIDNTSYTFNAFHAAEQRDSTFPNWPYYVYFLEGQMRSLNYRRQHNPKYGRSKEMWSKKYSFDDSHDIVSAATKTFASFVHDWCFDMKAVLVGMDPRGMGRVPLSKFYKHTLRRRQMNYSASFTESEGYLRELGALDETSPFFGKQVIIPNYLQSASNCFVSRSHYMVCCPNECETILDEIETAIRAPLAAASTILAVVGNLTIQATLDDDDPFQVGGELAANLEKVAAESGGQVQLHGRLFAQWLHYAFPRECPFPHQTGKTIKVTPEEYGWHSRASLTQMHLTAMDLVDAFAMESLENSSKEELEWMSQWDWQEEHFVETGHELNLPVQSVRGCLSILGFALALLAGVFCANSFNSDRGERSSAAKGTAHHV